MVNFKLDTPIPYINSDITDGKWSLNYPSRQMYWILVDFNQNKLIDGNWEVPEDVVTNDWGPDDAISNALIAAAPWNIKTPEQ